MPSSQTAIDEEDGGGVIEPIVPGKSHKSKAKEVNALISHAIPLALPRIAFKRSTSSRASKRGGPEITINTKNAQFSSKNASLYNSAQVLSCKCILARDAHTE